jgi:hypothetical protein
MSLVASSPVSHFLAPSLPFLTCATLAVLTCACDMLRERGMKQRCVEGRFDLGGEKISERQKYQ